MKYSIFLLFVLFSFYSQAQKTTIKTETGGFIVKDHSENIYGCLFVKGRTYLDYVMAVKPGFATVAFTVDSILKLNLPQYVVNLKKPEPLDISKAKKRILFKGFEDSQHHVRVIENFNLPGMTAANITTSQYEDIVRGTLSKYNFNIKPDEEIFTQKKIEADYILKGEVLECKSESKGTPGFMMSLIVKWTIYSVSKEEVVLKFITGGYSNNRKRLLEHEVLKLTIEDVVGGIITNTEFRNLLSGIAPTENKPGSLVIKTTSKGKNRNDIAENSKQATVHISSDTQKGNGYMISPDGYILVASTITSDSLNLQGTFENGLTLPLKVIATNKYNTFSVCKILGKGYSSMPIDTAAGVNKVGSDVIALGSNKITGEQVITKGLITTIKPIDQLQYFKTDIATNQVNNGGVLLNKTGDIVGMITEPGNEETKGSETAIPINDILHSFNISFITD